MSKKNSEYTGSYYNTSVSGSSQNFIFEQTCTYEGLKIKYETPVAGSFKSSVADLSVKGSKDSTKK